MLQPYFKQYAEITYRNGYAPIPVIAGEKRPAIKEWARVEISEEWVRERALNGSGNCSLGIRTSHELRLVDGDITDPILAALVASTIEAYLGETIVRIGQAPKFGAVYRFGASVDGRKRKWQLWRGGLVVAAIELLGEGQQFVSQGVHPATGKPYYWMRDQSPAEVPVSELPLVEKEDLDRWIDTLRELLGARGVEIREVGAGSAVPAPARDDEGWLLSHKEPDPNYSTERVAGKLAKLDPDCSYDEWLKIGLAVHHQTRGSEEGLSIWDKWSAGGAKYQAGACEAKWRDFDRNSRGQVTVATLERAAKHATQTALSETLERVKAEIGQATAVDELAKRLPLMAEEVGHDRVALDQIAKLAKARAKALDGVGVSLPVIKKLLKSTRVEKRGGLPEWAAGWVYVAAEDAFFDSKSPEMRPISRMGLDGLYQHLMVPDPETGTIPQPSRLLLLNPDLPRVVRRMYVPMVEGVIVEESGEWVLNTYQPHLVPDVPEVLTPEMKDQYLITPYEKYLEVMMPDSIERNLVLDFLAYLTQNPSKRVHWALLLKGVEGDGKSLLLNFLPSFLFGRNHKPVDAKTVCGDFTGWSYGATFITLEEAKMHGHNSHDAVNALKSRITNKSTEYHLKNKEPLYAPNPTSYAVLTNYANALPIGDESRRYLVVFTGFDSREEGQEAQRAIFGSDRLDRVYASMEQHTGVWKRWLLDRKLGDNFNPIGQAYQTRHLKQMGESTKSDEEILIRDVLEDGFEGVSDRVISTKCLAAALHAATNGLVKLPQNKHLSGLLVDKFKFTKYPKRVWWNNDHHWVWLKNKETEGWETGDIKAELDETKNRAVRKDFEE